MRRYQLLRRWSVALNVLGAAALVSGTAAIVWLATVVSGFWPTVAVVAIGVPVALLLAAWPLALSQGLRALADIGDDMAFESLTTRASSPY